MCAQNNLGTVLLKQFIDVIADTKRQIWSLATYRLTI